MRVTVVGAGSWGTTLALVLHQNQHEVTCWSRDEDVIDSVRDINENLRFLPGVKIPPQIKFTPDLEQSLANPDFIVSAVPTQVIRDVLKSIGHLPVKDKIWINVAKGIENKSLMRVSEIFADTLGSDPKNISVLSGPSHAEEVSRGIPTAIVAASTVLETAQKVQDLFMTPAFRVYASEDLAGVEIGGALKNIIAVAAGICDGAGFGDNTKAALITRGLVEINRMGSHYGARADTFAGLSGMGDLIVTCMSQHSRNRHVGEQIGRGRLLQEVLDEMVMVAEGVKTTESVHDLAKRENIEMPITEQVYQALFEGKPAIESVRTLMTRESKIEDWG